MKKSWILIRAMAILFFSIHVSAYSDTTNQFIATVEEKLTSMPLSQQQGYLQTLAITMNTGAIGSLTDENQIFHTEIKDRISQKSWTLVQIVTNEKKNEVSYQDMPNIDFDKVRQAWLTWHNELRIQQGLDPYIYHSDLEKTAKNWADYLVSLKRSTHKRASSDGYYNYWGIKKWFANLGVSFLKETAWKSAFSESIGYRLYRCTTWDCTQELINSTKKIFDTFVSEGKWGVHYKAMVMPHFKQIGLGFQFDPEKKYVYTVIHYAEKVLDD